MSVLGSMTRKRRTPRALLSHRRTRVRKQSRAVAHGLSKALATPGQDTAAVAHQVHALRTSLSGLRHDVLKSGTGSHAHAVADALHHLDGSLAKLAAADAKSDPDAAMELLYAGMKQFNAARRAAKKAGHDWTL